MKLVEIFIIYMNILFNKKKYGESRRWVCHVVSELRNPGQVLEGHVSQSGAFLYFSSGPTGAALLLHSCCVFFPIVLLAIASISLMYSQWIYYLITWKTKIELY
jgi:hypothetical protein